MTAIQSSASIRGSSLLTLQWWGGRFHKEPRNNLTPPHDDVIPLLKNPKII